MADEIIRRQSSPEITKLDSTNPRRNSTGIVKRGSTGKSSSQNYLRASTGSCHDFCKYGRQHSIAVQSSNPKPKRTIPSSGKQKLCEITQNSKPSDVELKSSEIKVFSSKQKSGNAFQSVSGKISKGKLKPSLDKAHVPGPPEIMKRDITLPSKQVEVSQKQNSSNTKIMKDREMKTIPSSKYSPDTKSKFLMMKPSSSSTPTVGLYGARKTSSKPVKVAGTLKTTVKKSPAAPHASLSPRTSGNRAVNLYARKNSSVKLVSPLKDQKRTQKAKSKPGTEKVQETTLHVVEAHTDDEVVESTQVDDIVQIFSSPSVQSLSLSRPDSQISSSHEDVDEEIEFIDKDQQQPACTDSEDVESEYTESEADGFISEDDETVNINEVDMLKGDANQSFKVGRTNRSAGTDDSALIRSKFRKGRTLDLQSAYNVPMKLKFRRGRILGHNEDKNAAVRKSFEKRELGDDPNGTNPSSGKVVLRHQDTQGKKDAQGLYNNVIEETASKLVESRKSKVKALVGAFETVISLQESKPSIPTAT